MGMKTEESAVNGQTDLRIELREIPNTLDEVVVIGSGTQAKRDVTGAISSVSAEDMEFNPK